MANDDDELYFDANDPFQDVYSKFPNHTLEDLYEWGVIWMDEESRKRAFELGESFWLIPKSCTKKKARLMGAL